MSRQSLNGTTFRRVHQMGLYQDSKYIAQSRYESFDLVHSPGQRTPHSGIYRCFGCGDEIASNAGNPFPPQKHHQHNLSQGSIRWQMVVRP